MMQFQLTIILLFSFFLSFGQQVQLSPVLVGSTGSFAQGGWGSITSSTGEAVIATSFANTYFLTHGFNQTVILQDTVIDIELEVNKGNESCKDAKDGYAAIKVKGGYPPFTYSWTPLVNAGDSAAGLSRGDYSVKVEDNWGTEAVIAFTIETDKASACYFHIYSGITPNGDGKNDVWEIDGIEDFPDNQVQIYNRWGDLVWANAGYNNTDIIWKGMNKNEKALPEGTYFYIVSLGNEIFNGWVELTR